MVVTLPENWTRDVARTFASILFPPRVPIDMQR